jgi:hypothetical protein
MVVAPGAVGVVGLPGSELHALSAIARPRIKKRARRLSMDFTNTTIVDD